VGTQIKDSEEGTPHAGPSLGCPRRPSAPVPGVTANTMSQYWNTFWIEGMVYPADAGHGMLVRIALDL